MKTTASVPIGLVDCHVHLDNALLSKDVVAVLENAKNLGVSVFINSGISQVIKRENRLSEKYKEVKMAIGISHLFASEDLFSKIYGITQKDALTLIRTMVSYNNVVSIGEIGLELPCEEQIESDRLSKYGLAGLNYTLPNIEEQIRILGLQLDIAKETGLPITCHCENAHTILLDMLQEKRWKGIKGIIHGFCSDTSIAEEYVGLGFYLSLNFSILYKKNIVGLGTIKNLGLKRVVLESDAPGFPPDPENITYNRPEYLPYFATKLAEESGIELNELCRITTMNAYNLFGL